MGGGGDRKWEGWLGRTPCCRALHSTKRVSVKLKISVLGPRLLQGRLWAAGQKWGGRSSQLLAVLTLLVLEESLLLAQALQEEQRRAFLTGVVDRVSGVKGLLSVCASRS